jgi:hypothetical protein
MLIQALREMILLEMRLDIEKAMKKLEILDDLCDTECDIIIRLEKVMDLLKEAEKI